MLATVFVNGIPGRSRLVLVVAIPTTTLVTSSAATTGFSSPVTFTAAISPSGPSGSVQFYVDGAKFGPRISLAGAHASLTTSTLVKGTHTVSAEYSGDDLYGLSAGTLTGGLKVNPPNTYFPMIYK
jgi:hypothetical protein